MQRSRSQLEAILRPGEGLTREGWSKLLCSVGGIPESRVAIALPEDHGERQISVKAFLDHLYGPAGLDLASNQTDREKRHWLAQVAVSGLHLAEAPLWLRSDRDVVLRAVAENGSALSFAAAEMREDREVWAAARRGWLAKIGEYGLRLAEAPEELRRDREVVLTAVAKDAAAVRHAAKELQEDPEVKAAERKGWLAYLATDGMKLRDAPPELKDERELVLAAVSDYGPAVVFASEALQQDPEVKAAVRVWWLGQVAQNGKLEDVPQELRDREMVLQAVARDGRALHHAAKELQQDADVQAAAWPWWLDAVAQDPALLQEAPKDLRTDPRFILEAVRLTRAWWLVKFAGLDSDREKELEKKCRALCGTGLIFTYYHSYNAFESMRTAFLTTGASVPGGRAYSRVMKELRARGEAGTATVWFDTVPVFGASADDGRWMHPAKECGRDMVPVPPDSPERHQMWRSNVESRNEDSAPEAGSKHPCWCCHWIRKVRQRHRQGAVICCTVSNIFQADWVENYSAGSSELSDDRAKEFGLPEESFRNGRPEGWGQGEILIEGWDLSNDRKFQRKFQRKAPVHSRTSLPLGSGCRWERHALDGMDFPVYVFFMP
ncbi:unnamed protein product [Effrenium voratum]|uniref:DUF4116 domain-containing protein n=1 Tax=Effrenium voratum TaxID=2562239 RepID=A0AA36JII7_9DINO|nr:unnamed protein product [Effrenium voratum]CAJ1417326.1 unnamed protein product [Effrenium voratum]